MAMPKSLIRKEKKSKDNKQTLAELSSAHRRLQAKCRLVQTSSIERIKVFFFAI